jgi:signal transduction histidine kinase
VASERTTERVFRHALEGAGSGRVRAGLRESGRFEATHARDASVERREHVSGRTSLDASMFRAALAAASDGVLLIDRAGTIVYANPAADALVCDSGLQGRRLRDLCVVERRNLCEIWRSLSAQGRWAGRLPRSASPSWRPELDMNMTVQRVAGELDSDEHYCVVLHVGGRSAPAPDRANELVRANPARRGRGARAEAMSTVQRMASEIAHDLNNQISVVLNYTFVLLRQMPEDSPLKVHVAEMQAAAWRASRVAETIRALQRHPSLQPGK